MSLPSLVIGKTSQLSQYFPNEFVKISSRNLNLDELSKQRWGTVFLCFAEQRTYLANSKEDSVENLFWNINKNLVEEVIQCLNNISDKIIYYSTAELWNNCNGEICLDLPFHFHENHYTKSKYAITKELQNKSKYPKVSVVYPFNFNSVYREEQYLFGKVFKSIITEEKIVIGDIDYYRELLHPKMVMDASINRIETGKDIIIGSGRLIHIGDFIKELYNFFGMEFDNMVIQQYTTPSIYRNNVFYSSTHIQQYNEQILFDIFTRELTERKLLL